MPPTAPDPRKEAPDPERAAGKEADPPVDRPRAALANAHHAAVLVRLRGIGANDAPMPGGGPFHRELRNRRGLASPAGLAPVPFAGGGVDHDQGLGKAGSAMLRRHPVRMAWRWLRHQPDSALSAWFRDYVSARDGRSRRRGIVALARRLPVAPLRFATTGLVPEGAVLSGARGWEGNEQPNTRAARRGLPGKPGRACDRPGPWFAAGRGTVPRMGPAPRNVAPPESGIVVTGPASAGQPNRTGGWPRRRARQGTATFCLDFPGGAGTVRNRGSGDADVTP